MKFFAWMKLMKFLSKALNKKSKRFLVKFIKSTKIKYKFFCSLLQSLNGLKNYLSSIKKRMLLTLTWSKMIKFVHLKPSNITQYKFLIWANMKRLLWLRKWLINMEGVKREFWYSVKRKHKLTICLKILKLEMKHYTEILLREEDKMLTEILKLELYDVLSPQMLPQEAQIFLLLT